MPKKSKYDSGILSIIATNPSVTRDELCSQLGASYSSIGKRLNALAKAGFIRAEWTILEDRMNRALIWLRPDKFYFSSPDTKQAEGEPYTSEEGLARFLKER